MLDTFVCQSITSFIERLATTGKEEIDQKTFKDLVGFAGQSEEYLKFCLERIFQHLEQKHSEIRYGAFLVVEELFKRSHCFRELLLDDFHIFLELTVESNSTKLLPPPLHVAKRLKQKVLQTIHKWYSRFGEKHKRLALSYNFLKHNLKVDFEDALKRNASELRISRIEQERKTGVVAKKVNAMKMEIDENVDDISRIVTEVNSCFCLLVPKPEDVFGDLTNSPGAQDNDNNGGVEKLNFREHGLQGPSDSIAICLNDHIGRVVKTVDNAAIIDNLRELCLVLKNRYLLLIKKWVHIASKASDQNIFRKVMDLKKLVEDEIKRFNQLQLVNESNSGNESSESDSDFQEVPEKEGYEAEANSSPIALPAEIGHNPPESSFNDSRVWKLWDVSSADAMDPTSLLATLGNRVEKSQVLTTGTTQLQDMNKIESTTSSKLKIKECVNSNSEKESRKEKLLKLAPKRPYDIDLYHWEDEDLKAPSIEIVETDGHNFWTPAIDRSGETIEDPNGIAALRTRVIEFSGKFQPVKWSCRVPLSNGSLCPRKDRIKCPFHGKIIARDEIGKPQRPQDIAELDKERERAEKEKPPDWQDPEFLKDIQAEIGIDLTIKPTKRGRKKKTFSELYPGLTDMEKTKNTPRARLEKKVFNKSAVKRVAETLDEISSKKFKDKFGDQWNYAMH